MRFGLIVARLTAVAGGLALLAACGAGSGAAPVFSAASASAPPSTSAAPIASPSPEPTYANALPGEKPPIRPPDVLNDAGAENFARYFVMTLDWTYATTDASLVSQTSTAECTFCNAFIAGATAARTAGDTYIGSRATIITSTITSVGDPSLRLANVVISYTALMLQHSDGTTTPKGDASEVSQLNIRLSHASGAWLVSDVKKVVTN
jgi:hypothetical protein